MWYSTCGMQCVLAGFTPTPVPIMWQPHFATVASATFVFLALEAYLPPTELP